MAEVVRYIDPDAAGLGDGTSWANAYTSGSAWEAAEQTDLVSDGDTHTANFRASGNSADTNRLVVKDWTTGASNYITMVCAAGDRHSLTRGTGYRIENNYSFGGALSIEQNYTVVIGISAKNTSQDSIYTKATAVELYDCLATDAGRDGIRNDLAGGLYVNCASYNSTAYGIYARLSCTAYYFTAVNSGTYGIFVDGYDTLVITNCYSGGSGTADYGDSGGLGTLTMTTCGSSDTTGSAGLQSLTLAVGSGTYFTNVTATSEDANITSSSSNIFGVGTDLSGSGYTTDYEGDTRASSPCLGADEYSSGNPWYYYAQQ